MARTRRKHSYRRSRRWNPDAVVAAPAPAKTNPITYTQLASGAWVAGDDRIAGVGVGATRKAAERAFHATQARRRFDASRMGSAKTNPRHSRSRRGRTRRNGWHMDREIRSSRHAKRHRSRARKHFKGYSRRKAAHVVDYALGRMNPRGRKSRAHKARGHRGHAKRSRRHRRTESPVKFFAKYRKNHRGIKRGDYHNRYRRNCGPRTNPAQFPMPFFSAMTNPGHRGHRGHRGRKTRHMRTRRNHPIKRKDARAMKRVLRQHHYSCR